MGYKTAINTLLGINQDKTGFSFDELKVGGTYEIEKDRGRIYPVGLSILLVDKDFKVYGYIVVERSEVTLETTKVIFKVLNLFTPEEQEIYTKRFAEATSQTGELKK